MCVVEKLVVIIVSSSMLEDNKAIVKTLFSEQALIHHWDAVFN